MTDPRIPEGESGALEEAYRRASAADPSRPSEATRAAILANARAVAAAARPKPELQIDPGRAAANDPFWWRSAAASVAIAVVGLMIWAPRFESARVTNDGGAASQEESVASTPAPTSTPPAVAASAKDRTLALQAPREAEPAAPRIPLETRQPRAAEALAPVPSLSTESLAAAVARSAPITARPDSGARANAGAIARADAPAADAALGGAPAAAERQVAPAEPPSATARKAEVREVVVTGAKRSAGLASPSSSAPSKAAPSDTDPKGAFSYYPSERAARTPGLDAAIVRGDAERVRELMAVDGALEARDARGRTPLMRAVVAGQAGVVRALLDAGADPNAPDAEGATPHAKAAARADILALLEERGGH